MSDTESKYNFILNAEDRASAVFENMRGKLDIFEQGISGVEETLLHSVGSLSGWQMGLASAAVTVTGLGAAILETAKSTAEYEDHLDHLSQKLGVTTEFLSKMQYAAKMEDIDPEKLEKSLERLEISIGNVASGISTTGNKAKKAFDELGISITNSDGSAKTSEQIMLELADAFGKQTDSSKKAALASAIFGRRSIDLIQILGRGRGALQQYFDEAENHGLVVTQESAEKAKEFEENLKSLEATMKGLGMTIGNIAIPPLMMWSGEIDGVIQRLQEARKEGSFWNQFLHELDNTGDIFQPTEIDKKFNQEDFTKELAHMGKGQSPVQPSNAGPTAADLKNIDAANKIIDELLATTEDETDKKIVGLIAKAQEAADKLTAAAKDPQPAWDALQRAVKGVYYQADHLRELDVDSIISTLKKPEQELAKLEMPVPGSDEIKDAMDQALQAYDEQFTKMMEEKQKNQTFSEEEETRILKQYEDGRLAIIQKYGDQRLQLQQKNHEESLAAEMQYQDQMKALAEKEFGDTDENGNLNVFGKQKALQQAEDNLAAAGKMQEYLQEQVDAGHTEYLDMLEQENGKLDDAWGVYRNIVDHGIYPLVDAQQQAADGADALGNHIKDAADKGQQAFASLNDELDSVFSKPFSEASSAFESQVDAYYNTPGATWSPHATGFPRVPYDGYKAVLHKDEEVLTASDPRNRNNDAVRASGAGHTFNITINGMKDAADVEAAIRKQLPNELRRLARA